MKLTVGTDEAQLKLKSHDLSAVAVNHHRPGSGISELELTRGQQTVILQDHHLEEASDHTHNALFEDKTRQDILIDQPLPPIGSRNNSDAAVYFNEQPILR